MGAVPWGYFVPYEDEPEAALAKLCRDVADGDNWSPEMAMEDMDAAGSAPMMLNMMMIGDSPGPCTICPAPPERLREWFGTTQPTREMIESDSIYFEDIERGEGLYIVVYKDGKPDEYHFAGYSFD